MSAHGRREPRRPAQPHPERDIAGDLGEHRLSHHSTDRTFDGASGRSVGSGLEAGHRRPSVRAGTTNDDLTDEHDPEPSSIPGRHAFNAAVALAVAQPGCADDRPTVLECGVRVAGRQLFPCGVQGRRGTGGRAHQALLVSAGRFVMGSPPTERGRRPDEVQVEVTLSKGFWTAKQEVTQGQWRRVIGEFPDRLPSAEFGEGDDLPVYWINFDEAETFCTGLTPQGASLGHAAGGLGVQTPDRGAMGVRLPRRHRHGDILWRFAGQASGQLRRRDDRSQVRCTDGARAKSAAIRPIRGASRTCTATCGNGAAITTTTAAGRDRSRSLRIEGRAQP